MVGLLGGPADLLERPQAHLAAAPVSLAVHAAAPGIVAGVDMYALGMAVVALGGGRTRPQDAIDARVGLSALAAPGDDVDGERPLALIHAADRAAAEAVAVRVRAAYRIGTRYAATRPVVAARITGGEQA